MRRTAFLAGARFRGNHLAPRAIIPALLLTLGLLISACSSSANAHSTSPTPSGGAAGATATAQSSPTSLPAPNAGTANCAQAPGFGSAGPASAGSNFTDVLFPSGSVGIASSPYTEVYSFQVINACTNSTSTGSVHSFFASSLPGNGWSQTATYPYKGIVSSACGDPYCWRKQYASNIRYVSLENVTAAGSVVVYSLRLATAPIPTFNLVTHYNTQSVPQSGISTVTAACAGGEQMVGGGYYITDTDQIYEPGESYPSSANAWTSAVYNNTPQAMTLTTYVQCVQANFPLNVQIVSKSVALTVGSMALVYATCPSNTAAVGGGYQESNPAGTFGWAVTSSPGIDFSKDAWSVRVQAKFGAMSETAYVLCASANAVSSRIPTVSTGTVGASSGAQLTPSCNSGEFATDGGFVDSAPGSEGDLFYYGNAPAKTSSVWIADVYNRDSSASHPFSVETFCVTPNPKL
jgi:hypothetical protein